MLDRANLSYAESMAIAVLKGDYAAARELAILLIDEIPEGATPLTPVRRITASTSQLQAIAYFPLKANGEEVDVDADGVREHLGEWLRGEMETLVLLGCDRVEVYGFPTE